VRTACAALCLVFAGLAGLPAQAAGPSVRVPATAPFAIHGVAFYPGERVAVTLTYRGVRTKTLTAGTRGTFVVHFWSVKAPRCAAYVVRAVGNLGSRAFYKPTQEECGANLQP
jgi:hypothetical protein